MPPDLLSPLLTHFGFPSFRPGQAEAIHSLLAGHHTLAVMPTGAGKSLIFQLAALLLGAGMNPAPTALVISPLIALMKDQVDSLTRRGIPATFINSALPTVEQNNRLQGLAQGKYRIVYVAPERLRSVPFLHALDGGGSETHPKISLLAVDEAHCISEWGHDFRPDYLHIAQARKELAKSSAATVAQDSILRHNAPLTAALTATATPQVQSDIIRLLGLDDTTRIVTGFNRPNLTLDVLYTSGLPAKLRALNELLSPRGADCQSALQKKDGATIVYTGTRRDAEEVTEFAREMLKIPAEFYHAGLPPEERTRIQNDFISGKLNVIAATNAFGMGIDRADVRQVIHYSLPGSLEAYYQEAGRAGRDGEPAKVTLLYDPQDRALQEFFITNSVVAPDDLRAIHNAILAGRGSETHAEQTWGTLDDLSRVTGLHPVQIKVGLAELERAGALEHLGDEGLRMLFRKGTWNPKEIEKAAANSKEHVKHRQKQLDGIVAYAESNSCRRKIILNYFGDAGEAEAADCCDNCRVQRAGPRSGGNVAEMNHGERAALVILDGIRRVKIKVGREKLAQILHGSKAQDILKFHHDQNIYYGRLAAVKQNDIEGLIGQLIEMGYIKVIVGEYPILSLTPRGENAIKQKETIALKLPKPLDAAEVLRAKAKLEAGGTVEYTAKLFAEGLKPEQIARKRNLAIRTIYEHLAQLIAEGKIAVQQVVPDDIRQQVENAIKKVGSTRFLSPIKALLPDEIDFEIIRCVAAGYASQTSEVLETSEVSKPPRAISVERVVQLGETKSPNAIPELIEALDSPDGNVRRLAASALGKIRDASAVEPLIDLLAREKKPQVRQYAVKALGSIGDYRAVELLQQIANDENEMYYTRDSARTALSRCRKQKPFLPNNVWRVSAHSEVHSDIDQLIIECVQSLPGKLPRSGVAKLLIGSLSERVEAYQSHPLYNRLQGHARAEVMLHVDELLESGVLIQGEKGYLLLADTLTRQNVTPDTIKTEHVPTQHADSIENFLTKSHPRRLTGSWHTGWSLGFHSRFAGGDWSRSGVGDLTYRLKYQNDLSALSSLIEQTLALIAEHPELGQVDLILPVPPSKQRETDPAQAFCKALAGKINLKVAPLVVKTRPTQPQKEMKTLAQKRANVAGAFALAGDVKGKRLLVVDDLFDSGATLEEISRLLLKGGAARVHVLTFTRTIHSDA